MNRAAAELNTVQSNVTARIRQLEEDLGACLFERENRGVSLTPAGDRLLPYAREVAQLLRDARRAVRDDGTPAGHLLIGSLETTAALRLSPVLSRFAEAHPSVDLVLRTGTTAELIDAVLKGDLEGAFVSGPVHHPQLLTETIFREELVIATAPGFKALDALAQIKELKIVVLRAGCSYRERLEEALSHRGIVRVRLLEFGTIEAIVGCVAAGLGVTLLPRAIIEPLWRERRVAMHRLPPGEANAETLYIRRRDRFVSSALAAFVQTARPTLVDTAAAK